MPENAQPFVTVIMPIRNEMDFIARGICSILDNDYPRDKMEILVVDGCSNDGTREIVEKIATKDERVILLTNTAKIVSTALNIGLRVAQGEIFIRIDGHAEVPPDFIINSVRCLSEHPEAWVAGGYLETIANSYVGQSIALTMQSPIGVGNSRFRLGNYEGWVDTLAFGAHHKWVIDKIGYFDEELVRNQDDEFNLRIILAGGKIWMSKLIRSIYYSRSSLEKLWRQYFQYGFWRIRTMQKHKKAANLRQAVPLLFISSIILLGIGSCYSETVRLFLTAELVVYFFGLLVGTVSIACKSGWRYALISPLIFLILHFAYGLGSLWGIIRFVLFKRWKIQRPEDARLSR